MVDEDKTMIEITKETREKLKAYGNKGQTYDDVINELLDIAQKREEQKNFY